MIPKIIHYCWFGPKPLPPLQKRCIESWQRYLPDYELRLWNEDNFDISTVIYVNDAYKQGKFAFVSDYVRFYALDLFGGIYLDTDVELVRSLDSLLGHEAFTGFELNDRVAPGLILGAAKGNKILREILDVYNCLEFCIMKDGKLNTVVEIMTNILKQKGLILDGSLQSVQDMIIYPTEYFSPLSLETNKINVTKNTYSIHHYAGSWLSPQSRVKREVYKMLAANRFIYQVYRHFKKLIRI